MKLSGFYRYFSILGVESNSDGFANSVNCIKSACGSLEKLFNLLPQNIKLSASFLVCQILMQLTNTTFAGLPEKVVVLPFTDSEKIVLKKCMMDS